MSQINEEKGGRRINCIYCRYDRKLNSMLKNRPKVKKSDFLLQYAEMKCAWCLLLIFHDISRFLRVWQSIVFESIINLQNQTILCSKKYAVLQNRCHSKQIFNFKFYFATDYFSLNCNSPFGRKKRARNYTQQPWCSCWTQISDVWYLIVIYFFYMTTELQDIENELLYIFKRLVWQKISLWFENYFFLLCEKK